MRHAALTASAAVMAVVATSTASAVATATTTHPCRARLPQAPTLPSSMIAWTSCGAFAVARNGAVSRLPRHWLARHSGGTGRRWGADINLRRDPPGDFFLLRHGRLLWRSHDRYHADGGSIAFGPGEFAFASYRRGIFVTDLHHPEHLLIAGRGLAPYTFTTNGDLIVTGARSVTVVARDGRIVRRVAYRVRNGFAFDERSETLYFVAPSGRLATLAARQVVLHRSVRSHGFLTLDRRLLTFTAPHAITVTDRRGAVVAHATWGGQLQADSGVSAAPGGKLFVFRLSDAHPGAQSGHAVVYLLAAGAARPRAIVRHRLGPSGCAVGAGFSWLGRNVLYSSADGQRMLINSATGRLSDLAPFARALPHRSAAERASLEWATSFPR